MPRKPHFTPPGIPQHVIRRRNNRDHVFSPERTATVIPLPVGIWHDAIKP